MPNGNSSADLTRYLNYQNTSTSNDVYWVQGKIGDQCNAVSSRGDVQSFNCDSKFYALCSQSAPISTIDNKDTSPKWRITLPSGDQQYTGYRDARGFRFEGIRYAAQPKRWEHTVLFEEHNHFDAYMPGSICAQPGNQGSEDCFFLNVYTPYLPRTDQQRRLLKPVVFFIHGGAFVLGAGTGGNSDGGNIASRGDVVMVIMNYRLGTLGFLALDDDHTKGNYGLADQMVALDWVHKHIRDFGGDPDRITIAGQSAGAASVRAFLGSSKAIGKYSAAIMQSNLGGYNFATPYSTYYNISTEYDKYAKPILEQTKCIKAKSKLDCLRRVDAHRLANMGNQASFLVVDGEILTADHIRLNGSEPISKVPLMLGTMQDDGVFFIGNPMSPPNISAYFSPEGTDWNSSVLNNPRDFSVPNTFGNNRTMNVFDVFARSATDAMFRCVDQATAAASVNHGIFENVWYFEFGRAYTVYDDKPQCQPPKSSQYPNGDPSQHYYKCHSGDLPYSFGNMGYLKYQDRDGFDITFSQAVLDMWTQFAWNHDPNPDSRYLESRGYQGTIDALKNVSRWDPVGKPRKRLSKRILDKGFVDVDFSDTDQCGDMDIPLDYYNT